MQLLLPLLALPWLARALGATEFGLLMYMCLFPPLVAIVVDWGLTYGGARESAWLRGADTGLKQLLGAAILARLLLAVFCLALAGLLLPFLPHAAAHPVGYLLAILAGISRGMNPIWFYQGAGFGMRKAAAFDAGASGVVLALTLTLVRRPEDWPLYLLFIAVCKAIAYGILIAALWRKYHPEPKLKAAFGLLRASATFFGTSFSQMACYNGGQLGLAYFLNAGDMGIIVAANKMLRAFASLVNPFTMTLFPELCILRRDEPAKMRQILRWSLSLTALVSLAGSVLCWLIAPWLILLGLGPDYAPAVVVLRATLLAAPLMACNNVLANQILIPFGFERSQLKIQAACALLALPLGAGFGALGMIWGASLPACLEGIMCAGFIAIILRRYPQALF